MQESFDVLEKADKGGATPALTSGEASEAAGHGLVVHTTLSPHTLWLDFSIALALAIALPLLLKKLLETELAGRIFQPPDSSAKATTPLKMQKEEFDFDA